jgi:serine kinase of HPr protein (carbohydrate metabolism regulator)
MSAADGRYVHATCVVIGEAGVLLRGPSGAGKSRLALSLIEAARGRRLFARLVGDDRIELTANHGALIARPHDRIAGLIEARGVGLLSEAFEPAARIAIVVELTKGTRERMPEPLEIELEGARLPALRVEGSCDTGEMAARVLRFLATQGTK